nr:hypothetical protein [Tanacetum cinerariifolium]
MMAKFMSANTASSSGSGTLPGNTVTNPKEDLKGITTRSGVAYQGPTTPTPSKVAKQGTEVTKDQVQTSNPQSTTPVQPTVTQSEPETPVSKPVVAPVSASMPNLKPSIPYPLRRDTKRRRMDECLALADLDANINLMPFSVWKGLSLPELTPTCMTLELADQTESKPVSIAKDVKVKVGMFHFPADFVVVDFEPDPRVPLILGRCFIKTSRALINVHKACEEYSQEVLGFFDVTVSGSPTPSDDPIVSTTSYALTPFGDSDFLLFEEADAFLEELKACEAKTIKSSIDEPPEVELKDLPLHLEYAFLEGDNKLPVIISKALRDKEKSALIKVLKSHKRAITWKLSDIQGNEYYCFLDGFSGYFQIPIDPRDQEKTTFTCPYGTFAYRRMPFGLCNTLDTFQRCMLAIFYDMVEKTMEVFMETSQSLGIPSKIASLYSEIYGILKVGKFELPMLCEEDSATSCVKAHKGLTECSLED